MFPQRLGRSSDRVDVVRRMALRMGEDVECAIGGEAATRSKLGGSQMMRLRSGALQYSGESGGRRRACDSVVVAGGRGAAAE